MKTMRVLLDTNLLISYLLTPQQNGVIAQVVEAGLLGRFALLLPEDLLSELANRVVAKEYLAERITAEQMRALADILAEVSEMVPKIATEIPAVTRDPKDDYLLAYALVGQADYLVTGDKDLLVLGQVEKTRIVTARDFAEVIKSAPSLS
jgi:putative PIN family toxin of toxin-antitoxin system